MDIYIGSLGTSLLTDRSLGLSPKSCGAGLPQSSRDEGPAHGPERRDASIHYMPFEKEVAFFLTDTPTIAGYE